MDTSPVTEVPSTAPPGFVHPTWRERFPWLVQGTTGRSAGGRSFDLGVFGDGSPSVRVQENWARLRRDVGMPGAVHARQVHGAAVRHHDQGPPGLFLAEPCDGHLTGRPGVLLTVTVADCVPVFLVDAARRAVGLLHAGWRGAAAGILEEGVSAMEERFGSRPAELEVHLGPSICGRCYEVGPEVFQALGLAVPAGPEPVDLRAALASRAVARGIPEVAVSVSARCTRCGDGTFFSHRGGDAGRQVGYLGIRT
jgi:YfiH family protein